MSLNRGFNSYSNSLTGMFFCLTKFLIFFAFILSLLCLSRGAVTTRTKIMEI